MICRIASVFSPSSPERQSRSFNRARPFFRSIGPTGFGDTNVATERNQSDRRNRCRQSKDKPHFCWMARTLFRNECSQQPSTRSDKNLAYKEWKVRQRTVRSFLSSRCNCGGIFIDPRRVESFSDGEYRQIQR